MIYLIFLFTILFFILAWRRLDYAVMLLIAALPAYLIRFNIFGLPATLLEVMIWAVFLIWLIKSYRYIFESLKLKIENCKLLVPPRLKRAGKINNRYPFDWEIVAFLFIALIAAGVAGFSAASLGIWKAYFFEPVIFFIVVLNIMKGEKGREKIFWALAISALAVSILAIYQKLTGQLIDNPVWAAENTRRVVSFFGYPNAVGLYLGPIILLMMGWLTSVIASDQRERSNLTNSDVNQRLLRRYAPRNDIMMIIFIFFTIILSLLSILSIYFAKSKGALLGLVAGLIVFGLMADKKIRWATLMLIIIAAAGLAIYPPAGNLAIENMAFTNKSGQIRKAGWADTLAMLKDGRLLTGAGLANFQAAIAPYHTEGIFIKDPRDPEAQRKLVYNEVYRTAHWQPLEIYLYPHNIILNFWSELGLAGVLLFIWIIGKFFITGLQTLSLRGALATKQSHEQYNQRLLRSLQSLAMTDKYIVIGLICAMVAIIVHGAVDVPYFKNDLAVMFWLFVAMVSLINLENKYGENNI